MRLFAAMLTLLPALALAQVPMKIGYQGRLLQSDGTPEAGSKQITFSLYDSATGTGAPLWTETQTLALSDGYYATFLGEVTALSSADFASPDRYLEISVGSTALSPRQRIGAVPFALVADRALNATAAVTATNVSGGTISATTLTVGGQSLVDSSGSFTSYAINDLSTTFVTKSSTDFVRNGTAAQSASFNVSGSGAVGGNFNAGRVGVAMSGAPSAELDVNGSAKISGTLTVAGQLIGPGGTPITAPSPSSPPASSYFACLPSTWSFSGTNKQTVTCSKTITLVEDAIVLVTAEGHMLSGTANSACLHFINVDGDVGTAVDPFGTDPTKTFAAPMGTSSASWKMSPTTRILDLPKGTHTFADTFSGAGACTYNGMSMHGVIIPKSLGATRASCSPANWSVSTGASGTGQVVCEQTLSIGVPSTVFAVSTGLWKATSAWAYAYNQLDGAPNVEPCGGVCGVSTNGTNQAVGAAHTYNTVPEAVQAVRVMNVTPGSHKFGFYFIPNTTATVIGGQQQLLIIPNSPNVDSGTFMPVWSKSYSGPGTAISSSARIFLPRSSVVVAATTGHWFFGASSHGYFWTRADGQSAPGPDLYPGEQWMAPAYSNATGYWDSVSHIRMLPLSGGTHVLENLVGCIAGNCQLNGDSTHWFSIGN